mgnify:CR=1 FL=1
MCWIDPEESNTNAIVNREVLKVILFATFACYNMAFVATDSIQQITGTIAFVV